MMCVVTHQGPVFSKSDRFVSTARTKMSRWTTYHRPQLTADLPKPCRDIVSLKLRCHCFFYVQLHAKVLKLCDGAIAHVSTVTGGSGKPDGHEEGATATEVDQDSNTGALAVAPGAGATTYVVVAGEDGAVRFYDLKFRLEVIPANDASRGG